LTDIESPTGAHMSYGYDAQGNRTSQTDAEGQATSLHYDARNRLTGIDHPGGDSESFGYDGESNVTTHTDGNGQVISSTYDGLNRLKTRTYGAASGTDIAEERWTHDGNGNLTRIEQQQADGSIHATTRDWDRQERLTSTTDRYGVTTTYGYDS